MENPRFTGKTINCIVCNKAFYVQKWRIGTAKYCSRKCQGVHKKGIVFSKGGSKKGRKFSDKAKENMSKSHLGKKQTKEWVEMIKRINSGSNSHLWKGGISSNKKYRDWQKNQWHHRNRSASGSHTFAEWETLKAQYNWTCPCCKKSEPEIKLTIDHIIPLSKGGSNNIENIQPLCGSCNCKKHSRIFKY